MDGAGRILLPAPMRRRHKWRAGSKFLVVQLSDGTLAIDPLDLEQMAKQLGKDLKNVDFDREVKRIKAEIEAMVRARHPEIAARMRKRR
jgi:bifunctional DNA-binding transcriptional regulator/antitoxin component of YhaV-PrlF toxin-antitoxin module